MPTIRKKLKAKSVSQNLSPKNLNGKWRLAPASFALSTVNSEASELTAFEKAYLSDVDPEFWSELRMAWCRFCQQAKDAVAPLIPVLTHHTETGWRVEETSFPLKIPLIHKAKGRATKGFPNSISRIVPVTIHAPADRAAEPHRDCRRPVFLN
ncbi:MULTISPECIES: hypothetical protein [Sphingobium]|jgi:hypothetical protein|uniref:hypothetical protein n=1 Tax=Sphingobium TaxID=165695 RepID=UPI0011AE9FB7|nr:MULTISPECIES: hypothetical protein [Sphingobium]KAA9006228.1 hypothetical protein F4U94_23850 [Sphingobium limneticum]